MKVWSAWQQKTYLKKRFDNFTTTSQEPVKKQQELLAVVLTLK